MIDGRIGTRGRIEYFFKAFGAVAILCIEMKLRVGNEDERLNVIAQVIVECDSSLVLSKTLSAADLDLKL
jgi:hypothetical protein